VASEADDSEDQTEGSHGPRECIPCRGSGQVISNLGGRPSSVTCPWCAGGGVRLLEVDAQAKWLEGEPAAGGAPDAPEDAVA
jgi:DnaJ-class molecular chaperone